MFINENNCREKVERNKNVLSVQPTDKWIKHLSQSEHVLR